MALKKNQGLDLKNNLDNRMSIIIIQSILVAHKILSSATKRFH